jgi:hypothetical protein
LNDVFIV